MSHNKKLIPLWREEAAFAREHGVTMICLEMHPGDRGLQPREPPADALRHLHVKDSLMSGSEGLRKAVQFLKGVMIEQPRGAMWWD